MRFFVGSLALVAAGSVCALCWMLARPDPSQLRVQKLTADNSALKEQVIQLRGQLEDQRRDGAKKTTAAGDAATRGAVTLNPGAPSSPANPAQAPTTDLDAKVSSYRERHNAEQIDGIYGKLMTHLGLNDVEKEHFKKLLLERDRAQSDGIRRAAKSAPELRKKASEEVAAQGKAFEAAIKAFLNDPGDYETFKQWENTKPERIMFESLGRALFDNSSEPLAEDQELKLLNLMAATRKAPGGTADFPMVSKLEPAAAEEQIAIYMQKLAANHQKVLEDAGQILTPGQIATLAGYLGQNRRSNERAIRLMIRPK